MANQLNLDTQVKGSRPPFYGADSGSANAYAVTTTAPLGPSLRTGSVIIFIAANGNTGASTLAVNGGSPIAIKKNVSTALSSGDIAAGQVVAVVYDGTNFQLIAGASTGGSGVSSFSGDGTLLINSGSTGAVTAALGNAPAHKYWGNNTGSSAAPDYKDIVNADLPDSGVSPGSYTNASVTVDAKGLVTSASSGSSGSAPPPLSVLISGGGVVWTGGLNLTVSAAQYFIAGTLYSSAQTNLSLATADPTNDRIDVIAVDTSGNAVVITGTPAANPAAPDIDPANQLELTFVIVPAGSSTPTVSEVDIYLENTEWTSSVTSNFNAASTNNPFAGSKDIEATNAVAGNNVTLTKPSGTLDLSSYSTLSFEIRNKASWPNPKSLSIFWLNGSAIVGSAVALKNGIFGFDQTNTTGYQQIVIPLANFNTGSNPVNKLEIQVTGGGGSIGFYIDNVLLQSNVSGGGGGNAGTVTSVALSMPSEFSVSGSPVTTAGTLAVSKANQSANQVYAGPTSGGVAAPAFRALVAADVPNIAESQVTNLASDLAAKAVSPLTTKGDLWTRSASTDARQAVGSDGACLQADSSQTNGIKWVAQPFDLGFQISSKPPANTRYLVWEFTRSITFPANFSGAQGKCLTNPTATASFTIEKNGSNVGTVSINTSGVFTFTSASGLAVTFLAGDYMSVVTPNPQDTTLADVGWVLPGTR